MYKKMATVSRQCLIFFHIRGYFEISLIEVTRGNSTALLIFLPLSN